MTIHFFEDYKDIPYSYTPDWVGTLRLLQNKTPCIITAQMGLLSTSLIEDGYRIFVHPSGKGLSCYEIKLGKNDCTDREIRPGHNLFHLWRAGEFHMPDKQNSHVKE